MLTVVIFVGFALSLVLSNFSDKLLSADFYKDTIANEDTYNRIYDEVLVDDELMDKTSGFLGDIKVISHQEIVDLLKEIIPPSYIQGQVEGVIERTVAYMNEDIDYLDAYMDLSEPLENVKPIMFDYLEQKIDQLGVVDHGTISCSLGGLTDPKVYDIADDYVAEFIAMADGGVPVAAPSLNVLPPLCRELVFAVFYDQLLDSTNLPVEVSRSLNDQRERLRSPFESGDTLGMLKVASRLLTEPLMNKAIVRARQDLIDGHRFDLISQLGEWGDSSTEDQIRSDISDARDWVSKARNFGYMAALTMVFGGAVLMGLVFFPSVSSMLRWPGIALAITGSSFFVMGKIAESIVPDRLAEVVKAEADRVSNIPPSITDLGGDILASFGIQLTSGIAGSSLILLIIGAALFGASYLTIVIKRFTSYVK